MRFTPVAIGSLVYGIVMLLFGLSLGLIRKLYPESSSREMVADLFSFYKYGLGVVFMLELELARFFERRWWSQSQRYPEGIAYCHVGSFYLRMGILIFGSVAVVQHCMRGFIEFGEYTWEWTKEPLIAVFILLQMALIFNFSITRMPLQSYVESFGFMHLLVVDILKWVRSALDEIHHLKHAQKHDSHGAPGDSSHGTAASVAGPGGAHAEHLVAAGSHVGDIEKNADEQVFGEYAAVVGAFNTEFLIAAAGILLIVWLNINAVVAVDHRWKGAVEGHVKRKKTIRITIGRTFLGLFLGLALSVFLALGVLVHRYYLDAGKGRTKWVMEFTNSGAYTVMLGACIVGMLVMRKSLDGKWDMKSDGAKDELLDKVLLLIGVTAEVVYSGTAIVGALAWTELKHKILTSIGYLLRLAQAAIQAHFILDLTGAVTCRRPRERTPGRQTILFLLWANLTLFFYYVVQTIHSVFVSTITGLLPPPYRTIIALALPFVLFYRFHSSSVLAELYKHHCSEHKEGNGHGSGKREEQHGLQEHTSIHPAPMAATDGQQHHHYLHQGTQF